MYGPGCNAPAVARAESGEDARAIALWGSTRDEMLAVLEALEEWSTSLDCDRAEQRLEDAYLAAMKAIRAHRERG